MPSWIRRGFCVFLHEETGTKILVAFSAVPHIGNNDQVKFEVATGWPLPSTVIADTVYTAKDADTGEGTFHIALDGPLIDWGGGDPSSTEGILFTYGDLPPVPPPPPGPPAPPVPVDDILQVFRYQVATYRIANDVLADEFRAFGLPKGLFLDNTGVITGVVDVPVGHYITYLQAHNKWGWGPMFTLDIIVLVLVPQLSSSDTSEAIVGEEFIYQIAASYYPVFYGAAGLPDGLTLNPVTGLISGSPTRVGSYPVSITAVNSGGAGTMAITLNVKLPDVPVIDTSALNGRAVTLQVNETFTFQPSASNYPTKWSADPLTIGLGFDVATGRLSGQFLSNGLYSITFVASNAGGDSLPVTFYFLVGVEQLAEGVPPPEVTGPIDVVDLWVDLDTGLVSIGGPSQSNVGMTVKRGDSTVVNVIFHRLGVPTDVDLKTLYFGGKVKFDEDYVVVTTASRRLAVGSYRTYPDFSDQNNELDEVLVDEKVTLIGEIQWDLNSGDRRSTQTFDIVVLRDLLHPDPELTVVGS